MSFFKSFSRVVTNVAKTITKPVVTLVTHPSKLNAGDIAVLATAGLAAPTVNAIRHPADIPIEAAIIGGGALLASATIAGAPAATGTVLSTSASSSAATTSSISSIGGLGPLDLGYASGGAGTGLLGVSTPADFGVLGSIQAGTPASMGANSFLSMVGNGASKVLNAVVDVGKAIAAPLSTSWLMQSLNRGNSQPPGYSDAAPPPSGDGGGDTIVTNGTPGSVGGNGSGYGPFGSTYPTPGYPEASDNAPTLFSSSGKTGSGFSFYLILFGVAFAGYWFLFRKKKFALA